MQQLFHPVSRKQRNGATIAMFVVMLPVLLALAAFAINIAHIEVVNAEVQITADAAVRAATRTYIKTGDKTAALNAARDAASRNPVSGVTIPINEGDLEYGVSVRSSLASPYSFTPSIDGNAIRLTTNSLASTNGSLIQPLFPLFGSIVEISPQRTATSTQMTIDISLVVDRSGSMAFAANEIVNANPIPVAAPLGWVWGDACPPNARWLNLVSAINAFNAELAVSPDQERVSLSAYNHSTSTPTTLTTNYSQIASALNSVSANFINGATNIGDGMLEGLAAISDPGLSRPFATKVMIVMTDGMHNTGTDPTDAATTVAASGVLIYTVTFSDEADQTLMQDVAALGSGVHYHAVTSTELADAFRQIANSLPTILTQ